MLSLRQLRILAVRTVQEFGHDNCSQMAAAISYYVLFSLFPLLIFSVGILGVALQDSKLQEDLVDVVLDYIPLSEDEGQNDVAQAVRDIAGTGSGAVGLLGLIGMAWSGSNLFGVIRRSLNLAYDLDVHRPIVRQKLLDLTMVVAFAPLVIASLAGTAAIRYARETSDDIPILSEASQTFSLVWDVLPLLIPAALSFVAFVFLYWVVPATRVKVRDVLLGAGIAAILFEFAKVAFAIYVANFSNYNVVFGSLGAVVAFLFWVYLSANIMLLGAEVAAEYPRVMRGDYDLPKDRLAKPKRPPRERAREFLIGLVWHPHERELESAERREHADAQ
ncbi:MAG TPA: YihY/virulence factor BrkB family protein [Dehalococcoidia bacterium]|nr:YihY/virulence factor BrkB family protein [Dehalococcoidia bacterium]